RAGEMVRMWAATLSRRSDEDVLAAVGLEHRAGVAVSSLSGGERRRLDLALALLGRPDVLFLDEPTTGLDPESRRDAWSIVRSRLAEGVTVVLTTHYLEEAEELSDRLAIMHEGRVVREGTVADIVAGEPARIAFTLPADAPAPPPLLGSAGRERGVAGTRYVVTTPQLQEDLFALLALARDAGAQPGLLLPLLARNRPELFNALALAPLTVLAGSSFLLPDGAEGRGAVAATGLGTLLGFALVFAGYYNRCTTAVARREELML